VSTSSAETRNRWWWCGRGTRSRYGPLVGPFIQWLPSCIQCPLWRKAHRLSLLKCDHVFQASK